MKEELICLVDKFLILKRLRIYLREQTVNKYPFGIVWGRIPSLQGIATSWYIESSKEQACGMDTVVMRVSL